MRNKIKKLPLILVFSLLIALSLTVIVGAESVFFINGTVILVSIIAMAITIAIFVLAVVLSYKKKLRGSIYPFDKFTTLDLTAESDTYSHSHTTRYKYKDSSNKK